MNKKPLAIGSIIVTVVPMLGAGVNWTFNKINSLDVSNARLEQQAKTNSQKIDRLEEKFDSMGDKIEKTKDKINDIHRDIKFIRSGGIRLPAQKEGKELAKVSEEKYAVNN